jgi:hypothetical protein
MRTTCLQPWTLFREEYDKSMAERTFGYSYEGGWLGFGEEQDLTTRPMTDDIKAFIDHDLLEDKIPDHFDQVAVFSEMLARIDPTTLVRQSPGTKLPDGSYQPGTMPGGAYIDTHGNVTVPR